MQAFIDYNFLIIGRSGSGKSATSKLLTGDPSITVANGLNEVTQSVNYYKGVTHSIGSQQIRFGILDIPGLDRIDNRFMLREIILNELQRLKINLHGIIYIASLTERDTVDKNKLFEFLDQLPWQTEIKKSVLIPILTKYDNLVIDSPQQDIERTINQFQKVFLDSGCHQAWSKHLLWVNFTKSLEFKMKINENIRQVYENQIQRLVQMIRKNKKTLLTAKVLKEYIELEERYIVDQFIRQLKHNTIPSLFQEKSHRISLHIKIQPKKLSEGVTVLSASSIGLIISKGLSKEIPAPLSLIMIGLPLSFALLNFTTKHSQPITDKISCQQTSEHKILDRNNQICQKINNQVESQWTQFNKSIQFYLESNLLVCRINKKLLESCNFFQFSGLRITRIQNKPNSMVENEDNFIKQEKFAFTKAQNENFWKFTTKIPSCQTQITWDPIIEVGYRVRTIESVLVIRLIEKYRINFSTK